MQTDSPLVRMVGITKKFGAVQALNNVSIEVKRGEVLGLLGDNGAGKSTLIKILAGVFPPTSGQIYFEEKPVSFPAPKEARAMGIETVHQGLSLVPIMSISRNFFLGREPGKRIGPIALLDKKRMDEESRRVITEIGLRVRSPDEYVSILSGGERQAISIGRAMYFGAKLLILDEPMSALSVRETRTASKDIEEARDAGATIIFITHNVYHVYPIANRFVILDRGVKIGELRKQEVSPEHLMEIVATGKMKGA
ncbi:MAG: Ribose import ATP-binding protein RbsA [Syntrophomonadaceae bacterium]|nr:Ribose import ATP-binding protein RbsA [Bacillota bacterium]MBT9147778.1 Ribose import ATP-binding protein RbsA [Bacillota bacterium]